MAAASPMAQYERWVAEARAAGEPHPNVAVLATATPDGRPSARAVVLDRIDGRGVTFHTSYSSRKGRELAANPVAALCSVWPHVGRQVRLEGRVRHLPARESDAYWQRLPAELRLVAAASPQSEPIADRGVLEDAVRQLAAVHPDGDVPRPAHWGGYLVVPVVVEFWEERSDGLHHRVRWTHQGGGWKAELLAP